MASRNKITAILLAAGISTRFGSHKLLQPLADGVPVGIKAAMMISRVFPRVVTVVRPEDNALIDAYTKLKLDVVMNPEAQSGMASSLVAGIRAAKDSDSWLIALADMPWVKLETIIKLEQQLLGGISMVAPVYRGQRGHPVGFSAKWQDELLSLQGDAGARELLKQNADELVLFETDDPGILQDVDYPGDLSKGS